MDPESLLSRLLDQQVDLVVIGGFAAVAHGSTLLTVDMDLCVSPTEENFERIHRAIADLHPVHRRTPSRKPLAPPFHGLRSLYLDTDWGQLDCLGEVTGVGDFKAVLADSEAMHLPTGLCRVLSLVALIRSKEALGRPKDREAVLHLRAIRERRARG